jgi:hypothetical protein
MRATLLKGTVTVALLVLVLASLTPGRRDSDAASLDDLESRVAALETRDAEAEEERLRATLGDLSDALELVDARIDRVERRRAAAAKADEEPEPGSARPPIADLPDPRRAPVLERFSQEASAEGAGGQLVEQWRTRFLDRQMQRFREGIPGLSAGQEAALGIAFEERLDARAKAVQELRHEANVRDRYLEEMKRIEEAHTERIREILDEEQYRAYRALRGASRDGATSPPR